MWNLNFITRENLKKVKEEIIKSKLTEEELSLKKEELKNEVKKIIYDFNNKKDEVMIDE